MAAKSKTISPVLFFFVIFALATDLVHGNDAYDVCRSVCDTLDMMGNPVAAWACMQGCSLLKSGIEPGSNTFEHGRVGFVQNFAEKPKLLTDHFNHGVAILEANPNTLMTPGQWDADALFFVAQGKATLNLFRQDKRETLGVKVGDIIRIPSGTKVLMINKDAMEKLVVIKFPQPVSTTGGFSEVKLLDPFVESSHQLAEGISVI